MTNYYIKRPNGRQKTFSINSQIRNPNGTTSNKIVKDETIVSINKQFLSNKISFNEAFKLMTNVKRRLGNYSPVVFNNENQKVLESFLSHYVKTKRYLVCIESGVNKYTRAIRALKLVSIQSASEDEIFDAVMLNSFTPNKNREVFHKLNTILSYLKRSIKIQVPPIEVNEVSYLTKDEVCKVSEYFDGEIKDMILLSFYSGLRIGELLALRKDSLKGKNILLIDSQIKRTGEKKLPKNRKKRKAYIHADGLPYLKSYMSREKSDLTRNAITKRFKQTCL